MLATPVNNRLLTCETVHHDDAYLADTDGIPSITHDARRPQRFNEWSKLDPSHDRKSAVPAVNADKALLDVHHRPAASTSPRRRERYHPARRPTFQRLT